LLTRVSTLVALALALGAPFPAASEVTFDWVTVGDPGNACDTQPGGCFGAVDYVYRISKFEVTNAQYAEFLNAKAASDPLALYQEDMGLTLGGIMRTGSPGSYSYNAKIGQESMPVNWVTFFDVLRFVNWLHNGQGSGDTETGAYTLLGGAPTPSNGSTVIRNTGATVFLTSEDEWFKAAYYDPETASYFDYPAGTDTPTVCEAPSAEANRANCGQVLGFGVETEVGSYTGSASPNGTFDQGGNLGEWAEAIVETLNGLERNIRGGSWGGTDSTGLSASLRGSSNPSFQNVARGFRVASLAPVSPVPSVSPLGMAALWGALAVAGWRSVRRLVLRGSAPESSPPPGPRAGAACSPGST